MAGLASVDDEPKAFPCARTVGLGGSNRVLVTPDGNDDCYGYLRRVSAPSIIV